MRRRGFWAEECGVCCIQWLVSPSVVLVYVGPTAIVLRADDVQTTCRRRADDDGRRRTLRRDGAKCRYSIRALRQSPHPRIARRSFPDDLLLFHAAGTMRRCRLIAIMLVSPTHYLLTCLRLVICRSGCAQHMSINAVG